MWRSVTLTQTPRTRSELLSLEFVNTQRGKPNEHHYSTRSHNSTHEQQARTAHTRHCSIHNTHVDLLSIHNTHVPSTTLTDRPYG